MEHDDVRDMVRTMFDEVEKRQKEALAARAVDDTLAGLPRVPWHVRLTWGPLPVLVGHLVNLIQTAALVAIALRLYGVV